MTLSGGTADVSGKETTPRRAAAQSILVAPPEVIEAIRSDSLPKSGALATARAAGLLAVKGTPLLIPHCHAIAVTSAAIDFEFAEACVTVRCEVRACDRTGPDMEALCGAAVAALTLYDVVKGVCRTARIAQTCLTEKEGGKTGPWRAEECDG